MSADDSVVLDMLLAESGPLPDPLSDGPPTDLERALLDRLNIDPENSDVLRVLRTGHDAGRASTVKQRAAAIKGRSDHPGDQEATEIIRDLDELDRQLGIRTYTTTSPVLVRAVQLTEDADWEAIAKWCGGTVVRHQRPSGLVRELLLPGRRATCLGQWVIQGVTGKFFRRTPEEFAATYRPVGQPAPDTIRDTALQLIRKGYSDPGATVPREFDQGPERDETEPVWAWGARAALENLVAAGLLPGALSAGLVERSGGESR